MKTLKTSEVIAAYAVIGNAKINKIESADDKYSILLNLRLLKEINDKYVSFRDDAVKSLQGENHEKMVELANRSQSGGKLSAEEVSSVNAYFGKFNSNIDSCIKPELAKTNELDLKTISKESFEQLIKDERNAWNAEQTLVAMDILL